MEEAAFSGSGVLGSLGGGLLASLGVAPLLHFCLVAVVALSAALCGTRWLLPEQTRPSSFKRVMKQAS